MQFQKSIYLKSIFKLEIRELLQNLQISEVMTEDFSAVQKSCFLFRATLEEVIYFFNLFATFFHLLP